MKRLDVTPDEIARVVQRFYALVRADATLGPVFAAHVEDWPAHEDKIAAFWRNAILRERAYSGNPMQKHLNARNVDVAHFPFWLGLFDKVLADSLETHKARAWSELAHRIGRSLSFGLDIRAGEGAGGIPKLSKMPVCPVETRPN